MEPITKKKTSVSPFIKIEPHIPEKDDTEVADPISRTRTLAPGPTITITDLQAVDKRVDALIDYLEHWIKVGNLEMMGVREYVNEKSSS